MSSVLGHTRRDAHGGHGGASAPAPDPDYVITNAGTLAARGGYVEDGVSGYGGGAVPAFSKIGGGMWLYQVAGVPGPRWCVDPVLDTPHASALYRKASYEGTPYIGTYDVVAGVGPGATVSAG